MLLKQPSKRFLGLRRGLKVFLIFEGVVFVSMYGFYSACNRSQSTRKYFHDHFPLNYALEFYYRAGELYGTQEVRRYDKITWEAKE